LSLTYSSFLFNSRKNYYAGGHRVAATYSLIETTKLNGLKPLHYMADELVHIPDHPARQIADERRRLTTPYSADPQLTHEGRLRGTKAKAEVSVSSWAWRSDVGSS
jgi:hypothetical protein